MDTTVTGTETLRPMRHGRSWRNHLDTLVGSVDTMTSSKACASTRRATAAGVSGSSDNSPVAVDAEPTQPLEPELELFLSGAAILVDVAAQRRRHVGGGAADGDGGGDGTRDRHDEMHRTRGGRDSLSDQLRQLGSTE